MLYQTNSNAKYQIGIREKQKHREKEDAFYLLQSDISLYRIAVVSSTLSVVSPLEAKQFDYTRSPFVLPAGLRARLCPKSPEGTLAHDFGTRSDDLPVRTRPVHKEVNTRAHASRRHSLFTLTHNMDAVDAVAHVFVLHHNGGDHAHLDSSVRQQAVNQNKSRYFPLA